MGHTKEIDDNVVNIENYDVDSLRSVLDHHLGMVKTKTLFNINQHENEILKELVEAADEGYSGMDIDLVDFGICKQEELGGDAPDPVKKVIFDTFADFYENKGFKIDRETYRSLSISWERDKDE